MTSGSINPWLSRWIQRAKEVQMQQIHEVWGKLDAATAERSELNNKVKVRGLAASKRLVGCTTSGAAKYRYAATSPGIQSTPLQWHASL